MLRSVRQKLKWICAGVIGACCMPLPLKAGAFLLEAGTGQIIISTRFEQSDRYFDRAGKLMPVRDYRKFEFQVWMEYGLTDDITLIFAPSMSHLSSSMPPTPVQAELKVQNTYGHAEAGARMRLHQSEAGVFSVQATVRIGEKIHGMAAPLVRQEANELDLRILYGRKFSLGKFSGYLDAQTGYRFRAGLGDEWRTDLTLGIAIYRNWTVLLQNFNLVAQKTARDPAKRSHKLQTSLVYTFSPQWSFQAGVFTTVAARNARQDSGVIAAVWRKF